MKFRKTWRLLTAPADCEARRLARARRVRSSSWWILTRSGKESGMKLWAVCESITGTVAGAGGYKWAEGEDHGAKQGGNGCRFACGTGVGGRKCGLFSSPCGQGCEWRREECP